MSGKKKVLGKSRCLILPSKEVLESIVGTVVECALEMMYLDVGERNRARGNTPVHIVIMDPGMPFEDVGEDNFESAILFEKSLGVETDDVVIKIARSKAKISWKTKKSTSEVSMLLPHLLESGDTKYEGGVYRDGIAVGFSGFKWWWDQQIGESVITFVKAFTIGKMREIRELKIVKFL